MPETSADKLLVAVVGGIILWIITSLVRFLLYRNRLGTALLEDIKFRREELNETRDYLDTFFNDNIKVGSVIESYALFTRQGFPFFEDVRKELFKYFSASDMIAIMRCYEAFDEAEILMEGITKRFQEYVVAKTVLTADEVAKLNRRKTRIIKIIEILGKGELRHVRDIPRDYKGMMTSVDIIRK